MSRRRATDKSKPKSDSPPQTSSLEIPEGEQWRLINESGILNRQRGPKPSAEEAGEDEDGTPLGEELFHAATIIIPFSFFFLMMEILVHQQYGQRVGVGALARRMVSTVPILSFFIFYSTRYKHTRLMQACFFFLSIVAGSRLIYIVNHGSYLVNMMQCPPLATAWVYGIFQLDLAPSAISLGAIGIWVWWKRLKIIF